MRDNFLIHFSALLIGILISSYLFVYFEGNDFMQLAVSAIGCIYYMIWGIIHHAVRNRLTTIIAVEYILVGTLVFLVLLASITIL